MFSLISFIPLIAFAQSVSELPIYQNGSVNYYEKIQVDTISKSRLYLNSKQVFLNTFKASNYRIQLDNQNMGSIVGIGFNDITFIYRGVDIKQQMWFTLKIQVRDGSYDLRIYDLHFRSYTNSEGTSEPSFEKFPNYSNAINKKIQDIIKTVKTTMISGDLTREIPIAKEI
jgi:hypothetical protein